MDEQGKLFNQWKRKQTVTCILAMIHAALVGLEYTSISSSALYYLNHILYCENANGFYRLALGAMDTSSAGSNLLLGKYMDKARNARRIILGTGILSILGNLLYSLPYSPWLLVLGRFLCGFSDSMLSVMTVSDEPGYDLFFISKQQEDLFQSEPQKTSTDNEKQLCSHHHVMCQPKQKKELVTVKEMFSSFDFTLISFSCGFVLFLGGLIDLIINMVCLHVLNWTLSEISFATLIAMGLNAGVSILSFSRFMNNERNVYFFNLFALLMEWINMCALIFIYEQCIMDFTAEIVLVSLVLCSSIYSSTCGESCSRLLVFILVHLHSSSYCEGIRISISRLMCGIAFYAVAFVYMDMIYTFFAFMIMIIVIYACFLNRRHSFY